MYRALNPRPNPRILLANGSSGSVYFFFNGAAAITATPPPSPQAEQLFPGAAQTAIEVDELNYLLWEIVVPYPVRAGANVHNILISIETGKIRRSDTR